MPKNKPFRSGGGRGKKWKTIFGIVKLREDVLRHRSIHVLSCGKDPENDCEYLEGASQETSDLIKVAGLDWKGFAKVKGYPIESEVPEVKVKDDENSEQVKETEESTFFISHSIFDQHSPAK